MLRLLASIAILSLPLAAFAQDKAVAALDGTYEVKELDRAGKPVAGAVVLIEDLKSLQVRSYIVLEDGKFRFRGLSADANYQLRARANGLTSKPKTISVFETKPLIVVNLTLGVKPKRAAPPPTSTHPPGNPS